MQYHGFDDNLQPITRSDEQLLVMFKKYPRLSPYKSKNQGTPIYDDEEVIQVLQPGERDAAIVKVEPWHIARFPKQYEAYKKGQEYIVSGTPLDLLFPGEPSTVLGLKAAHIHTVQQLAALSDSSLQNIPFGRSLQDKAKAYLSQADSGKTFHTMQKQIDDLTAKLEQMTEIKAEIVEEEKRRGRPRKVEVA